MLERRQLLAALLGTGAAVAAVGAFDVLQAKAARDSEAAELARAYNATGADIAAALAPEPGNIVLSPFSIGTAMAMALAGAHGETAREMAKALRHTLSVEQIEAVHGKLAALASAPGNATAGQPAALRLDLANALFVTAKLGGVSADYRTKIAEKFGGELFANASLEQINAFVSAKTNGKIETILNKLSPNSRAVLVNAIYFKAPWAEPFDAAATRREPFHISSTQSVEAQMMHRTGRYAIVARDGYQAIRLPYADGRIAMVVVLPDRPDGIRQVAETLDSDRVVTLSAALAGQAPSQVALALPRFKANQESDLAPIYRSLGMTLAFDPDRADFSVITGRPNSEGEISIGQIKHKAVVEVSEEGTEAAAATAVEMLARSAPRIQEFRADRPFLFYITEKTTGAALFQGRIVDPR